MKKLKNFQTRTNKEYILILILLLIIGLLIGFAAGTYVTVKATVVVARTFINDEKVREAVDENLIKEAIFKYKNNIGGCLK